jgi:hypothetical protein
MNDQVLSERFIQNNLPGYSRQNIPVIRPDFTILNCKEIAA